MNVQQQGSTSPSRIKNEEPEEAKPNPALLRGQAVAVSEPGPSGLFSTATPEPGNRKRKRKVAGMEGSLCATAQQRVKIEPPEGRQPSASNIAMTASPALSALPPLYRCRKNSFTTSIPYDHKRVTERMRKKIQKNITKLEDEITKLEEQQAASANLVEMKSRLQRLKKMKADYDTTLSGSGANL